jgi:hypothetical protein
VPDENATLKDVTVSPSPSNAAESKEPEKKAAEEPKPVVKDPAEAEAAEIGKILLDSGYTKAQINDLMQAPQALASIRNLLATDQKQFVKQLALSDPDTANKLRDAIAEEYVELFGDKGEPKKADGKTQDSELMQQVRVLTDKVQGFETQEQRRQQATALAATQARYNARVDDFFGQDGIKNLGMTKTEQKAVRALLDKELASDTTAVQRVSNGNFVDVAPAFKRIIEEWASDKKSATEAEKRQRDNVEKSASYTFPGGPANLEVPAAASESWDATEEAFAKAIQNAR